MNLREKWRTIIEFPKYEISDQGNIYHTERNIVMRTSQTAHGNTKITLTDYEGNRYTRSVALLVADAFVVPPNFMCDQVIALDGNLSNVAASNLAWRPRWFAWKYIRQLREPQPNHYYNLTVRNIIDEEDYESIIEAGITEGLLFENIWQSTYRGNEVFPSGSIFEIVQRV